MPRYAAFLRGVSPANAKMPEVAACFESAGLTNVRTVLSSGNVVFSAGRGSEAHLAGAIEGAMMKRLGRRFLTIVRPIDALRALLGRDPFADLGLPAAAKRVVTFLREDAKPAGPLPFEREGATIWCVQGREAFTSYTPTPRGPVFMEMIKQRFGDAQTTRTWDTVGKVVKAAMAASPGGSARTRR
jgi:uncharacterized protein (DUF1697 family)